MTMDISDRGDCYKVSFSSSRDAKRIARGFSGLFVLNEDVFQWLIATIPSKARSVTGHMAGVDVFIDKGYEKEIVMFKMLFG